RPPRRRISHHEPPTPAPNNMSLRTCPSPLERSSGPAPARAATHVSQDIVTAPPPEPSRAPSASGVADLPLGTDAPTPPSSHVPRASLARAPVDRRAGAGFGVAAAAEPVGSGSPARWGGRARAGGERA